MDSADSAARHDQAQREGRLDPAKVDMRLGSRLASMTSLKCVQAMTLGAGDMPANRRSVAHSRPTPSLVSVPFPNSSMTHSDLRKHGATWSHESDTKLGSGPEHDQGGNQMRSGWHRPVADRSMDAIWLRSSMNCDCPSAVASWLAMRVKMRSVSPTTAFAQEQAISGTECCTSTDPQ